MALNDVCQYRSRCQLERWIGQFIPFLWFFAGYEDVFFAGISIRPELQEIVFLSH